MIYTENTKKALKLMYETHKEQKDKSGLPYVFHPFIVASQMDDENSTVVALLHDVVEDSDVTIKEISDMGFSKDVIDALSLLTHSKEEDYYQYIKKIALNSIAKKVKIADLTHNSDITRLNNVTEKDLERLEKYKKSLDYLKKGNW